MRCLGPATLALERSVKRRRVSNETEGLLSKVAVGVDSLDSLFSSLIQTNAEDQFPTIAWVFDDDDKWMYACMIQIAPDLQKSDVRGDGNNAATIVRTKDTEIGSKSTTVLYNQHFALYIQYYAHADS